MKWIDSPVDCRLWRGAGDGTAAPPAAPAAAVSRAFGNADYKAQAAVPPELQRVTAEPTLTATTLGPGVRDAGSEFRPWGGGYIFYGETSFTL